MGAKQVYKIGGYEKRKKYKKKKYIYIYIYYIITLKNCHH